jgi:gliding motility-associated-like protein
MYYITITDASGAIATDSIYIGITHLNPNIAVSASYNPICIGDSLVLTGTGGISYIWSTTDTTNTIQVAPPSTQTYYVTGTDGICFNEDSIIIDVVPMPIVGITGDSILCFGNQVQITASGGGDYLWNNSSTNASISVSPTVSQYYFVTVSSPPCMVVDSFFVLVNPLPVAFAGYDTAITIGAEAPLHGSGGIYYEWTPSFDLSCSICPNPTATPNETTTYWLTVANEFGCIDEDNVVVEVFCGNVFFPNAFTPNGDINNGEFKVQGNCIKSIDIKIFNRWGDLLFETNNLENSWDGIYNGLLVPTDVYTYKYSCQFITGEHKSGSGSIIVFY